MTAPDQLATLNSPLPIERRPHMTVPGGIPLRRADGLAAMLISTCEGAVALSHVEGSLTPFEFAAAELVQAVTEALIGSPPRHDL